MKFKQLAQGAAIAAAFVFVFAHVSATAGPNLVVNGSFELGYPGDGICGNWWYEVGYGCSPNSAIPGWTQTGGGLDWHHNTDTNPLEPVAQDGEFTIDMVGSNDFGAMTQDVPTKQGDLYSMVFWWAVHPFCVGSGTASATAAAGTSSVTVGGAATNVYTTASFDFHGAPGTSTTISFTSLSSEGCGGVLIDNVSVVQVLPTTADQCKNGGWETYGAFKNQGDCVSYVATKGKNPGSGG